MTGLGGGPRMSPALLLSVIGNAATVVSADLTADAIDKTSGALGLDTAP